jgi:hypothetical protein
MNRFATVFVALGFATAGSTAALADQPKDQISKQDAKPQPVQMSDAQLDNVAAGQLIDVVLIDVVDVRNVQVAIPVNANVLANVNAAVLGTAVQTTAQRLGRQTQVINPLP